MSSSIDNLPGGGKKFSAISGSSSFKSKLKSAVKSSSKLSSLADKQEEINKAIRRYQEFIRKGSFNSSYQQRALRQIRSKTEIDNSELRIVKKILKKLGQSPSEDQKISRARIVRAERDDSENLPTGMARDLIQRRRDIIASAGRSRERNNDFSQPAQAPTPPKTPSSPPPAAPKLPF